MTKCRINVVLDYSWMLDYNEISLLSGMSNKVSELNSKLQDIEFILPVLPLVGYQFNLQYFLAKAGKDGLIKGIKEDFDFITCEVLSMRVNPDYLEIILKAYIIDKV